MLLLTFEAAGQRYAVDAARVVEVIPRVGLRPVPHAPACLAGLFEYRGEVVSVVDVGVLLGSAPAARCLSTRIILVDREPPQAPRGRRLDAADDDAPAPSPPPDDAPRPRSLLGLVAEQVSDLSPVDAASLVPPPVRRPGAPYLGPLAETPRGVVQLLHVDQILKDSLRPA